MKILLLILVTFAIGQTSDETGHEIGHEIGHGHAPPRWPGYGYRQGAQSWNNHPMMQELLIYNLLQRYTDESYQEIEAHFIEYAAQALTLEEYETEMKNHLNQYARKMMMLSTLMKQHGLEGLGQEGGHVDFGYDGLDDVGGLGRGFGLGRGLGNWFGDGQEAPEVPAWLSLGGYGYQGYGMNSNHPMMQQLMLYNRVQRLTDMAFHIIFNLQMNPVVELEDKATQLKKHLKNYGRRAMKISAHRRHEQPVQPQPHHFVRREPQPHFP